MTTKVCEAPTATLITPKRATQISSLEQIRFQRDRLVWEGRGRDIKSLHMLLRHIQTHLQRIEAPLRDFGNKPRHVRESWRHYDGSSIRELVVLNAGFKDCAWGNCRMCGLSTRARELSATTMQEQLQLIASLGQLKECESLFISPYSFFSDHEMSEDVRQAIYEIIRDHTNIRYAVFMSRPEYITKNKLRLLREHLPGKEVIIFMGAETANPFIAQYCIDKGYMWPEVEAVSNLMKGYGIRTGLWVLLKPPFLSETEGIADAVRTIRMGRALRAEIRLMPMEIMDFTIVKLLHELGRYRTPWLWSVIAVLKEFGQEDLDHIDVSGPHFERDWSIVPREVHSSHISAFPANCSECTERVHKKIMTYNEEKNIVPLVLA